MKKILILFTLLLTAFVSQAQINTYRTTGFYSSENTTYGWANWSNKQPSNMIVKIDCNRDLVYIDSNYRQLYQIVQVIENGYDNDGNYIMGMRFIDQDGDRGTMKLVMRNNGQSQIYIIFGNVRWCYDVVKVQ